MYENKLEQLFAGELKDVYHAEHQIIKAMPKMIDAASNDAVRRAFKDHLGQTQRQVQRLEKVFELYGMSARSKPCKGMQGIIEEGKEMMKEKGLAGPALDAALIAAAQKVEHYEMATYGTLRTWAQEMGNDQAAHLLQQTLDEEGETDHLLTAIAEQVVNMQAEHEMEEGNGSGDKNGNRSTRRKNMSSKRAGRMK